MAVLPIPCKGSKGSLHPRAVPAEGHSQGTRVETGLSTMPCVKWGRGGAIWVAFCCPGMIISGGELAVAVALGRWGGTGVGCCWKTWCHPCLRPVTFPAGVWFCKAAPASRAGAVRDLISTFRWARPSCGSACSPPGTGESEPAFGNPQPQLLSGAHLAGRIHNAPGARVRSPGCQR